MTFGLGSDGFTLKRLADIIDEINTEFEAQFGEVTVEPNSVNGRLIGTFSNPTASVWEQIQNVYNGQRPSSAEGTSLDDIVQYLGIVRLEATKSTVTVECRGTEGTIITSGNKVRASETSEEYEAIADVTITKDNVQKVEITIDTAQNSEDYEFLVDYPVGATTITSTFNSGVGGLTAIEIATGLAAEISTDNSGNLTVVDNLDGTITVFSTDLATAWSADVNSTPTASLLLLSEIWTPVSYSASNAGIVEVPAGAVDTIVNAISGFSEVNNLIAATSGTDTETDADLRARREEFISAVGSCTVNKIETRILQEVDDVTSVFVVENRGSTVDGDGRPPHSFETVVQGGEDQDIADKIWELKAAGIETYGTVNGGSGYPVVDSQGVSQIIKFSRPTPIYVWCYVEIIKYTEESFPADGIALIKEAIRDWGDALGVGKDVLFQRINSPIFTIAGVKSADIWLYTNSTASSTPTRPVPPTANDYDQVDHTMAANEVSVWTNALDTDNIEVSDVTP